MKAALDSAFMSSRRAPTATTLVLSNSPERIRLRELQAGLEGRRDRIAAADLEIETLREQLAAFEMTMNARLAVEHDALHRIDTVVAHMERWAELLETAPRESVGRRGRQVDRRRGRELEERQVPDAELEEEVGEALFEPDERLKGAYRALARRFHPDLARTEEECLRFGELMRNINQLYHAADTARLEALVEQARGGEIEDPDLDVDEQTEQLEERLAWFDAVIENLSDERAELEGSSTCELLRNVQQAEQIGRDVIEELRAELRQRVEEAYANIPIAVERLEANVRRYNRDQSAPTEFRIRRRGKTALDRQFDPFSNKKLIRLSLDALTTLKVSRAAQQHADWLRQEGPSRPPLLRLLLLTYVAEMSPFPLAGLDSFDDLRHRFDYLARHDEQPIGLEAALVEVDDLVEFGVRRATEKIMHLGLRFRNQAARDAIPVALRALPIRRTFRDILAVLGEQTDCPACRKLVFLVPLYRTRGLDDLRANACPDCGHAVRSYWMPKGKDVQAVLNDAYLDFEIISEWSFRLGRVNTAIQLLPTQVERMTVGQLKRRLLTDLFNRYDLGLRAKQVHLMQRRKRINERTALSTLDVTQFSVKLTSDAELTVGDAVELLRHRIRNRFKAD
ncbi:MAG: hypothetical protein V3T05_10280 [Myxococcota bacterium]